MPSSSTGKATQGVEERKAMSGPGLEVLLVSCFLAEVHEKEGERIAFSMTGITGFHHNRRSPSTTATMAMTIG